jgi:hypothetical protein
VKERREKKIFENKKIIKNRVRPVFQARAGTITNLFFMWPCGLILASAYNTNASQ